MSKTVHVCCGLIISKISHQKCQNHCCPINGRSLLTSVTVSYKVTVMSKDAWYLLVHALIIGSGLLRNKGWMV